MKLRFICILDGYDKLIQYDLIGVADTLFYVIDTQSSASVTQFSPLLYYVMKCYHM